MDFYIFGYELLFRGIVWFTCFEAFGFWPALLINLFLYAVVHLQKKDGNRYSSYRIDFMPAKSFNRFFLAGFRDPFHDAVSTGLFPFITILSSSLFIRSSR
jgi:membrane protease YdiL (CAAX protease family)